MIDALDDAYKCQYEKLFGVFCVARISDPVGALERFKKAVENLRQAYEEAEAELDAP